MMQVVWALRFYFSSKTLRITSAAVTQFQRFHQEGANTCLPVLLITYSFSPSTAYDDRNIGLNTLHLSGKIECRSCGAWYNR